MPRCQVCGQDVEMPYSCSYCSGVHCETHRLPEAHSCSGADQAAEARRERQRTGHPGVDVKGGGWTDSAQGRGRGAASGLWDRLEGSVAKYLLYAIAAIYVLEVFVEPRVLTGFAPNEEPVPLFDLFFVLDATSWTKPWTLLTSVFAHGSLGHILVNGIVLFFFGPILEKRIGSRRFLYLVLAGGVLAGLAQVGFYSTFLGEESGVLGISGALMAIMGALTVLGPRLKVLLFFIVPMPLWLMMVGYAALDLLGFIGGGGGIAHLAHLTGLALGLAVGWNLRQKGYAFPGQQGRMSGGIQSGRSRF